MHATFFQKLILVIVLSALAAGLIVFYDMFIEQGDRELNKGFRERIGIDAPSHRR